ncbi:hypothetical protein K504DRAFT_507449 [Pleomassaria siparia CBS 279.74]|uniref:Uncharacterized protein n=1 Tax=Pleomassaria siparia CBS 279.74 TaxID=1314801 RepID=A0A6G1JUC5_9PLEO|nr:hypothetical protein K504DRAFT_507449 [Pleomassaria siparia CBS 279.74]
MAPRYIRKSLEGEERPTSGPISLTNFLAQHPGRKKNNKSWRPMQLSDLGDGGNNQSTELVDHDFSSLAGNFGQHLGLEPSHLASARTRPTPFDLPPLQTNMAMKMSPLSRLSSAPAGRDGSSDAPSSFARQGSADNSPASTHFGVVKEHARLFGKQLPDQIRLHQEMGQFDGQLTFIAHPNRDVSAHQWSASSFQWVNVGLYSHTRRKIEGSLASDRLRGLDVSHNTIEYFKAVAEQREINIKENGRPEDQNPPDPPNGPRLEALHLPNLSDRDRAASPSSASDSINSDQAEIRPHTSLHHAAANLGAQPTTHALQTIRRDYLEDPFVTPNRSQQPAIPVAFGLRSGGVGLTGSMNFDYKFPSKSGAPGTTGPTDLLHDSASQQLFAQRERERLSTIRHGMNSREPEHPSTLREVQFGEETTHDYGTAITYNHPPHPMSPEEAHVHQILKNKLTQLGNTARRLGPPQVDARVAIPDVPGIARTILAPPGMSIANPHRVVSTLNAKAAPYPIPTYNQDSDSCGSDISTVNAPPIAILHYSDPDSVRVPHVHEIANGLGHQTTTPQNFKGPFFTETMPTTNDPTASLAFHVSEEEKLSNWFCDGQRPARQQEYAKTLMATAEADGKNRGMAMFGAIGDGSFQYKALGKYANTPTFVGLYENLYEYVEEGRAGRADRVQGKAKADYFTRAWKPALAHQGDQGTLWFQK